MDIIVHTDASHDYNYSLGTYAFVIVGKGKHIKICDVFKDTVKSSMDAEIKAMANAMHKVFTLKLPVITSLTVYTDCSEIIKYLDSPIKNPLLEKVKDIQKKFELKYSLRGDWFSVKHVKAHTRVKDMKTTEAMHNRWCDLESRKLLRTYREFLGQ